MEPIAVTVEILGKDYRVACYDHEKDALIASAAYLNEKMRDIKNSGKVVGGERVAVMAALNIAHELLQNRVEFESRDQDLKHRLQGLQEKIEGALDRQAVIQ
ncbi:MAG: cell division protein ZapA [Gammaproteobacteria bacterium]|nr:cell division protein ZapA [Gammaproteobacteria bacterium]MDH5731660.1 cell division protein ZapA [Gammaproteobacteria bacterium]